MASVLSKEFLGIQAIIKCRFTLKGVLNMIITYSQWWASSTNKSIGKVWNKDALVIHGNDDLKFLTLLIETLIASHDLLQIPENG